MERRSKGKKVLLIILLLLVFILVALVIKEVLKEPEAEWDDTQSQVDINQITYEGKQYNYNNNLTNILFIGIDNSAGIRDDNMPSDAGQADCLILLTLDKDKREARILQIPRDTMTEVDVYNVGGNMFTTLQAQIATQYAYNIGGTSSCVATKKTVSELLYDLPIDGYLAMDYTNIATVNDAIGGVEITVPQDYTMIDPAFQEGVTLTLMGEQAHDYVRWRDTNVSFSNYDRMDRQVQYILAMIDTLQAYVEKNGNDYSSLFSLVEKNMVTNLNEDQIEKLLEYHLDAENIEFLPGEAKKGEIYEEFYVNEENLQKMLIETFYILEE